MNVSIDTFPFTAFDFCFLLFVTKSPYMPQQLWLIADLVSMLDHPCMHAQADRKVNVNSSNI